MNHHTGSPAREHNSNQTADWLGIDAEDLPGLRFERWRDDNQTHSPGLVSVLARQDRNGLDMRLMPGESWRGGGSQRLVHHPRGAELRYKWLKGSGYFDSISMKRAETAMKADVEAEKAARQRSGLRSRAWSCTRSPIPPMVPFTWSSEVVA